MHCSLLHTEWMGRKLNLLDCPGYADFLAEGLGAMRVCDSALITINAAHGLGTGTDAAWDYCTHFGLPKAIVVNGLDKAHVDFDAVRRETDL